MVCACHMPSEASPPIESKHRLSLGRRGGGSEGEGWRVGGPAAEPGDADLAKSPRARWLSRWRAKLDWTLLDAKHLLSLRAWLPARQQACHASAALTAIMPLSLLLLLACYVRRYMLQHIARSAQEGRPWRLKDTRELIPCEDWPWCVARPGQMRSRSATARAMPSMLAQSALCNILVVVHAAQLADDPAARP